MKDDKKFGVPEQKKFPLYDADHVISAIKFFNYVDRVYEKQLAKAILRRAKEYGVDISEMNIGDNNRFKKYINNSEMSHSIFRKEDFKMEYYLTKEDYLQHHGILGQKWGIRRFQNPDGSLTAEGRRRYRLDANGKYVKRTRSERKAYDKKLKQLEAAKKAKKNKSPRDKDIKQLTDKQLQKYISRMELEKEAITVRNKVRELDPKPLTKGEKFMKLMMDKVVVPALQESGKRFLNALVDQATKTNNGNNNNGKKNKNNGGKGLTENQKTQANKMKNEGKNYDEIARAFNVSIEDVKSYFNGGK